MDNDIKNSGTDDLGSNIQAGAKQALTKTVWDGIRPVALALSGLYLLFVIGHLIWLPESIKILMVGFAGTTAIILFGLSILMRHLVFSPRLTYPIGFFIIILASLNSLMHLYLTMDIFQTTNLLLVIFGAGYFILSKRWYFGSLLLIILGWSIFIILIPNKDGIVHFSIALFSGSILATLFNLIRTRTLLELEVAKEQMEFMAKHDALTKLPNRWLFDEQTEQMLRLARRTNKSCAILMIDLDNFKMINDRYGHLIGDQAIKKVGQKFTNTLRESDLVSRWGGDEFAILLFDVVKNDDVIVVIKKIFSAFDEPIIIDEKTLNILLSVGVAKYPQNGDDIILLLKHADSALYVAKEKQTGHSYSFFDENN